MNITIKKNEDTATLIIEGRLDTITAPQLENEINATSEDANNIVLDMNALEYISSAGLRVLLSAQKKLSKTGSMKLVGVNRSVMDILEMTGFADILVIE